MQVKVSAANMWLTIFIAIMQMGKGGMSPFTNYALRRMYFATRKSKSFSEILTWGGEKPGSPLFRLL